MTLADAALALVVIVILVAACWLMIRISSSPSAGVQAAEAAIDTITAHIPDGDHSSGWVAPSIDFHVDHHRHVDDHGVHVEACDDDDQGHDGSSLFDGFFDHDGDWCDDD